MGLINRGSKSHGGTAFLDGTLAIGSEVEYDIATLFNEINGLLSNSNVSASAAIEPQKIDGCSDNATERTTEASPGVTGAPLDAATLREEIERLRYKIKEIGLGSNVKRLDGTAGVDLVSWIDTPCRGPNLIKNPNFHASVQTAAVPQNWSDLMVGTRSFDTDRLSGGHLADGFGQEFEIIAGSPDVVGVKQSLAGLKANTKYLIVARARVATGTAHLRTTSASGATFGNLDLSTTSTSYVTLSGVILVDAIPSIVDVQLTTHGGATDDVFFSFVGAYECNTDPIYMGQTPWSISTNAVDVSVGAGSTDLLVSSKPIIIGGPGYQIEVRADIPLRRDLVSGTVGLWIEQDQDGVITNVAYTEVELDNSVFFQHVSLSYVVEEPTLGSTYTFTLKADADAATVCLIPGAATIVGGGTKQTRLLTRLVRVSG